MAIDNPGGYVLTNPVTPGSTGAYFNMSMTDELLNISQISTSHILLGNEMFDKFIIKFSLLAADIDSLNRSHPDAMSQQVMDKLHVLKRDIGILSIEVKNIDNRSSEKAADLERLCDRLKYEIVKLREEVANLVTINADLHRRLSEFGPAGSGMNKTQKSVHDKVNASTLYAAEDKVDDLAGRNKELRAQIDVLKKEKNNYFSQVEWLRSTLDDHMKKFNDLLKEKLEIQDTLEEVLKEENKGQGILNQLRHLQTQEVT